MIRLIFNVYILQNVLDQFWKYDIKVTSSHLQKYILFAIHIMEYTHIYLFFLRFCAWLLYMHGFISNLIQKLY